MISIAQRDELSARVEPYAYFGVYMLSAYDIYATDSLRAQFYTVGDSMAMMIMGNEALICGEVDDEAELGAFLHMMRVKEIKSTKAVLHGYMCEGLALMQCSNASAFAVPALPQGFSLAQDKPIYDIVHSHCFTRSLASSDNFYSDTCLRKAKAGADIIALERTGQCVSTAGVYALNESEAYIAGVATQHSYTKRGCASYLLATLAHKYSGKTLTLVCDAHMSGFYSRLGYERAGTVMKCVRRG